MAQFSKSKRFMLSSGYRNFGYQITDFGPEHENPKKKYRKRIFWSSSANQALDVFESIEKNHTILPEGEKTWTPKLLIIEEKHGNHNYLVRSPEDLNQVPYNYIKTYYYLKPEYCPFKKWEYSKHYVPIDEKAIELCENERFKKEMTQNNEAFIEHKSGVDEHNKVIDAVTELIENGNVKNAYSVLLDCEFLYHTIDLTTFSNERLRTH